MSIDILAPRTPCLDAQQAIEIPGDRGTRAEEGLLLFPSLGDSVLPPSSNRGQRLGSRRREKKTFVAWSQVQTVHP